MEDKRQFFEGKKKNVSVHDGAHLVCTFFGIVFSSFLIQKFFEFIFHSINIPYNTPI